MVSEPANDLALTTPRQALACLLSDLFRKTRHLLNWLVSLPEVQVVGGEISEVWPINQACAEAVLELERRGLATLGMLYQSLVALFPRRYPDVSRVARLWGVSGVARPTHPSWFEQNLSLLPEHVRDVQALTAAMETAQHHAKSWNPRAWQTAFATTLDVQARVRLLPMDPSDAAALQNGALEVQKRLMKNWRDVGIFGAVLGMLAAAGALLYGLYTIASFAGDSTGGCLIWALITVAILAALTALEQSIAPSFDALPIDMHQPLEP